MTSTEDLLTPIHKALRSMLYQLSTRVQTVDFADLAASRVLATDLENDFDAARSAGCVLCTMAHHAVDEEVAILPAAAKFGNSLVTSLIAEHHDLTRREIEIARSARALLAIDSAAGRVSAGVRLNALTNQLIAAYLTHMNREEAELVPLLQAEFTDAQQAAMRGMIIASIPPARLAVILGWMLPSLNAAELSGFLGGLRRAAPPPLQKMVEEIGAAKVEPTRWAEVQRRLAS